MPGPRAGWLAFIVLGLVLASTTARAGTPGFPPVPLRFGPQEKARCLRCHGMPNFAELDSAASAPRDLHVDPAAFGASAHATLSCRSCHADVTQYPHVFSPARAKVSCGADCHARDAQGRPYSHARETQDIAASVHGQGRAATNPDSPRCGTCHGGGDVHGIPRVARRLPAPAKMALCVSCHDDAAMMARNRVEVSAVASYRRSFHYKAIHFGARGTAVCQDCHGVHRVLAKGDTASTIAAGHLPRTCGQEGCHRGARMNFAMSGANHLDLRIRREPLLRLEERFFVALTAGTMLALLAGIVLDVQRRLGWLALAAAVRRRAMELGRALARLAASASAGTRSRMRRLLVD
ncbi:MAG TPA: hypothetical protein VI792_10770 [Candidatus Eisenbacteria bacterium]